MNMLNGFRGASSSQNSGHVRNQSSVNAQPPGRALVDGYTRMNGNSIQSQPRINGEYDATDPISMHLLMENALGDSKTYEVLSPDDVDNLKRELSVLSSRIEATQRKLALETKVRDATTSMSRLQKPGAMNGTKRGSEESEEAARKCEEIGEELWRLEKQEHQMSKTLLQHNAAVLQSTHKGFLKDKAEMDGMADNYTSGESEDMISYKPSALTLDEMAFGSSAPPDVRKQNELILGIGQRVQELNTRLQSMMREAKVARKDMPQGARGMEEDPNNPDILFEHIDLLEDGLSTLEQASRAPRGPSEDTQAAADDLQNVNFKMFQTIMRMNPQANLPDPPNASTESLPSQIEYLIKSFGHVQQEFDKLERYEQVIEGLWNSLVSPEEADDFSLQRFAAKIQDMQIKFSGLQEAKNVLTRQVQQQRELNDTADHAKDAKIEDLTDELDATRGELENTRQETNIHLEKLTSAMEELELTKSKLTQNEQERAMASSQASEAEKQARTALEQQLQQARAEISTKAAEAQKVDEAYKELEGQFVRAQTELTIAKADLDSVHGSKAERAAEKAADPVLQARINKLESELSETMSDYENMTKATIEHEKERETMESTIDGLRDQVEKLEAQLNDEKINLLGAKSPGTSSDRGGVGTSAGVLRNEFRKMMRESKAEHTKALRAEQDERRKLEATVRALKKDQLQAKPGVK